MAQNVTLGVVVGASQTKSTNQFSGYGESKCPPGFVQRIKAVSFHMTQGTAWGGTCQFELKVGTRTLIDLRGPSSAYWVGGGTKVDAKESMPQIYGAVPVNDVFVAGEEVYCLCTTPASSETYIVIMMERISLEELQAEAGR